MVAARTRRRAVIVTATAAITLPFACRIPDEHFSVRDAAGSADAPGPDVAVAIDTPPPPCNLSAAWSTPVVVPGLPINDSVVRFSQDELTGYFGNDPDGTGSASVQLYMTTRSDLGSAFGSATVLANPSTADGESTPTVSANELAIYFVWGEPPLHVGSDRDIWRATRGSAGDVFGSGAVVPGINLAGIEDDYPFVAANGDLWFVSKRGSDPVFAIYRAPSVGGNAFGTVVRVDELSSTSTPQYYPLLSHDLLDVYFTRGNVLYTASRGSAGGTWSIPTTIDVINAVDSGNRHRSAWISPDGCRLYVGLGAPGSVTMYVSSKPPV